MTMLRLSPDERAKLALELTMRDALGGLEELVNMDIYRVEPGCFEILGIERPVPIRAPISAISQQSEPANILTFPKKSCLAG